MEKPLETYFRVVISSESKVARPDLLKLKHVDDERWEGGLYTAGSTQPDIPFIIDPTRPDATTMYYGIVGTDGQVERFVLTLKEDRLKNGRQLAFSQSLGTSPGPFEETDIWVAEEEDPPVGGDPY